MPSRKGMEQALTWLRSKMAERDTLDAINAEVCFNVLMDMKRQKEQIGALYNGARMKLEEQSTRGYFMSGVEE